MNQHETVHEYNIGDLVMFRNRTQTCSTGMKIEAVDTNMFDTRLKVNGLWWVPTNFMPFDEWRDKYSKH